VGAAMHGVRDLETAYIYYCKGILKCPGASELVQARWALLGDLCKWDSILASARENRWCVRPSLHPPSDGCARGRAAELTEPLSQR
jgi:hypothetical protein